VGRFFLSREALDDLDLIRAYIAQDNPEAAERVLEAAYRICKVLAEHPEIGRLRTFSIKELAGIRSFVISDFPNYIIFYRAQADGVQIIRVLHGARNLDELFE
jgi:toxin ParE1/3/4